MKSVLISIQPKWCELIASGKKTVEVRKTKPKLETPFKVYIYCTLSGSNDFFKENCNGDISQWNKSKMSFKKGKVIGEFVCDKIIDIDYGIEEGVYFDGEYQEGFETNGNGNNPTCLSFTELENYLTENVGYGWHISDLVIYDTPKELSEFHLPCIPECDGLCEYGCLRPLKRPPQSWCYVERLGEG